MKSRFISELLDGSLSKTLRSKNGLADFARELRLRQIVCLSAPVSFTPRFGEVVATTPFPENRFNGFGKVETAYVT
jgi:hypothetical protein